MKLRYGTLGPRENHSLSIPMVIIISIVINGIVFMGLPFLTKTQRQPRIDKKDQQLLIAHPRQPKPPEVSENDTTPTAPAPPTVRRNIRSDLPKPKIDPGIVDLDISQNLPGMTGIPMPSGPVGISPIYTPVPLPLDKVDRQPQLIKHLSPLYPAGAKRRGIQGLVIVKIVVDKTGKVQNPVVMEATPEGIFEESAVRAVRRWRFIPAIKDKHPVDVYVVVPLKFELTK